MDLSSLQPVVSVTQLPLEQPHDNSHLSEQEQLNELCREFEALLVRQILRQARQTVFPSMFDSESTTSGIYQDMINNQLAESISQGGTFGLANSLQAQLNRQIGSKSSVSHD